MLPNFLVIGAPRAGSTWLYRNLREHPDIFVPKVKEVHFFDRNYEQGIKYYEAYFAEATSQTAIGEVTPDYLHGAYTKNDVPALIKENLPNVKLIASLRNPVERAYSRFWNSKAKFSSVSHKTFEQQLADSPEFLAEGMYFEQLERFYRHFTKEQILVLLFEDLIDDPNEYLRRVYRFLGVREDFRSGWESVKVNQATGKGNLARSSLLVQISRVLMVLRLHSLEKLVRDFNSFELQPMSVETRRYLAELYREPNEKLRRLTGLDLTRWT